MNRELTVRADRRERAEKLPQARHGCAEDNVQVAVHGQNNDRNRKFVGVERRHEWSEVAPMTCGARMSDGRSADGRTARAPILRGTEGVKVLRF